MNNSISKYNEDLDNSKQNLKETIQIFINNTPKMGLVDVKTVDSTANVINKVEPNNIDLELVNILLIIIVVIMCSNFFYKIYKLHNKCLKKKYMSQANDLDKI